MTTTTTTTRSDAVARWLKVLADPTRLTIFDLLMDGERCNCELGDALGMAPNLISHHIGVLRRAGLVVARRDPDDARWIYYSIDRNRLVELSAGLGAFFDPSRLGSRQPVCDISARVD